MLELSNEVWKNSHSLRFKFLQVQFLEYIDFVLVVLMSLSFHTLVESQGKSLEAIEAERVLYLSDATELSPQIEAAILKSAKPVLESFEEVRRIGLIDPLCWIVLLADEKVVLVSRDEFSIDGNPTLEFVRPVCKSHIPRIPSVDITKMHSIYELQVGAGV